MTDWSTPRVAPISLRPRSASLRERAIARESPLRNLDWWLVIAVVALIGMGALLVWSATKQRMINAGVDSCTALSMAGASFAIATSNPAAFKARCIRSNICDGFNASRIRSCFAIRMIIYYL